VAASSSSSGFIKLDLNAMVSNSSFVYKIDFSVKKMVRTLEMLKTLEMIALAVGGMVG